MTSQEDGTRTSRLILGFVLERAKGISCSSLTGGQVNPAYVADTRHDWDVLVIRKLSTPSLSLPPPVTRIRGSGPPIFGYPRLLQLSAVLRIPRAK